MNRIKITTFLLLLMSVASTAQISSPPKVATVNLQTALLKSREGRAAAEELQRKSSLKEQGLKKLQTEITALREELNKSSLVASENSKDKLSQNIDQKTKTFNRELEDLRTELEQEQNRILNNLGPRMIAVVRELATSAGYGLVVDVSDPQTPILYASEGLDITGEVVRKFDERPAASPSSLAPGHAKK